MSATFTMYGRDLMLRAIFAPDLFTPVTTLAVALTRTVPATNASIEQLMEPDAELGYARAVYPVSPGKWASTGFAELYNVDVITFDQVTSPWGRIAGFALLDVPAGQCVAVGSLANPFQATSGMIPKLDGGAVMLGLYD